MFRGIGYTAGFQVLDFQEINCISIDFSSIRRSRWTEE